MKQLQAKRQDSLQPARQAAPVQRVTRSRQGEHADDNLASVTVFDNRPETLAQRQLAAAINQSPRVAHLRAVSETMNNGPRMATQRRLTDNLNGSSVAGLRGWSAIMNGASRTVAQRRTMTGAPESATGGHIPSSPPQLQPTPSAQQNGSSLPGALKSGVESLSGISMDRVRVHYNSSRPTRLKAHAYAQGTEIHLAAGQEHHLPHEAWHVVQQAQSRVRPTMQAAGSVAINNDPSLEREADVMGARTVSAGAGPEPVGLPSSAAPKHPIQGERQDFRFQQQPPVQRKISFDDDNPLIELEGKENATRMRELLLSFGDISEGAAKAFVDAMQSPEKYRISRDDKGIISFAGKEKDKIDQKSLFDLYRRRLQLYGYINGLKSTNDKDLHTNAKNEVAKLIKGKKLEPKNYGEHHGRFYQLGLTSVFNTLVDDMVEGFDPTSTDFSDFAIATPLVIKDKRVATGKGGEILADGWYMYVIGKELAMKYFYTNNYVQEDKEDRSKVFSQYIPHTVLSAGESVWAAGTFLIRDGMFALVDNGSGHYRPSTDSLGVVEKLLSSLGYDVSKTRFLNFEQTVKLGETKDGKQLFPNLAGIDIGLVKKGLFFMNRPERSREIEQHFQAANKPSEEAETFGLLLLALSLSIGEE